MKLKLIEHIASIMIVISAFAALLFMIQKVDLAHNAVRTKTIEPYLHLNFLDINNPEHRALLKETLDIFYPESTSKNDSLIQALENFRQEQFTNVANKTGATERGFSTAKFLRLSNMYLQFILIYLIVMGLSYHAAQSLAIMRFVRMKQRRSSYIAELFERFSRSTSLGRSLKFYGNAFLLLMKALGKGIVYAVLFAPAYVIGYSLKSTIDTSSSLFMIALGVISNGLLINYSNKFYAFLVTESKKGYVETALVKNLNASYKLGTTDGISYRTLFIPKSAMKELQSHVFSHIYLNARYQYLPSLKEFASFLITGLIIIEMALNIQGHLGYELLQNIFYRDYVVVMAILVAIFLVVKGTEIAVDVWTFQESRKYENKGSEAAQ